jgi:hypothetical protein
MASDIDKLLEYMRKVVESRQRTVARQTALNVQAAESNLPCEVPDWVIGRYQREADRFEKWITLVEELRVQATLDAMANAVVVKERVTDGE